MAQNVGRLGVVLGLDTAEFVKGLNNATLSLSKFVDKIKPAIAVGTAGMTALIAKTVAYADEINDLAEANDMAISSVMALSSALAVSGGKADNAGKLIASFSAKLGAAVDGSKQAQDAFKKVGVSLNDLANLTTEQLLDKVVKSLADMKDPVTRNAVAMEILGKAAKNINWSQMADDIEKNKGKYLEAEAAIKALGEAADATQKIYKEFITQIAIAVGEDLKTTIDFLERFKEVTKGVGTVFKTVFETIAVLAANVGFVIERTFTLVNTAMELGFTASQEKRKEAWKKYAEDSERLRKELDMFEQALLNDKVGPPSSAKVTSQSNGPLRKPKNADAEALEKQKAISQEFARQQKQKLDAIVMQGEMIAMTEKQKEIYKEISRIEEDRNKKLEEIDQKIKEAREKGESDEIVDGLEKQKAAVFELSDAYSALAQKAIEANEMRVRQQQLLTNAERAGVNATIENLATLGQHNKKAFDAWKAMSIATTIIDTITGAQATYKALAGIPIIGPALATAASIVAYTAGMAKVAMIKSQKYQGREKGGVMSANTPYMVGEKGPELVLPGRSSAVIPNNQLSSHMGGTTNVTNYYIDAIDTKSFEQRVLGSANAVWAANKYADKSLAIGRGRT